MASLTPTMAPITTDDEDRPLPVADADRARGAIAAALVTPDGQPAECTLYPADATGTTLMTRWITASEGAFVDLDDVR